MIFYESTVILLSSNNIALMDIFKTSLDVNPTRQIFNANIFDKEIILFSESYFSYTFNHSINFLAELMVLDPSDDEILESFPSKGLARSLEKTSIELEREYNLLNTLSADELSNYSSIDIALAAYNHTVPLKKLQYPEPFIASASFIHTDIGFIHVLQYNYWL
tara:strand:+ start:43 stop:531 length:489 start_codon:yes stop_codon:yes gene_type:complete